VTGYRHADLLSAIIWNWHWEEADNFALAHTNGDKTTLKLVSLTPLLPDCFLLQIRP
jgi:hypothetical protein